MKRSTLFAALCLSCANVLPATAASAAQAYSPYPPAGTYDASDAAFKRQLTVRRDGSFTLEVMQKGRPGHLRSGAGEGRLADAPGGWRYAEGRCSMALRRAAGGMQLHAEGCAGEWGDVPFDGKYVLQGAAPVAAPASAASPAAASDAGLPSRRRLNDEWSTLDVGGVSGKTVIVMARPVAGGSDGDALERFSKAAFVIDTTSDYASLSRAEMARPPLALVDIPLPATGPGQGLAFEIECTSGKVEDVVVVSIATAHGDKPMSYRRAGAWVLDGSLHATEVKPVGKVKCPVAQPGY
jgi:hypothetical protein